MRLVLIFAVVAINMNAFAQQNKDFRNSQDNFVLKTNPLTVLVGPLFPFSSQYGVSAEVVHGYNQSSQISAAYLGKGVLLNALTSGAGVPVNIDQWTFRGYRFQAAHRFYMFRSVKNSKLAPEGLYFGPHSSLASLRISDPFLNQFQTYIRGVEFNANLLLGVQVDFFGLYVDFNFGLGYKKNFWQETQGNQTRNMPLEDLGYGTFYRNNLKIHFGFETGFAF